MTPDPTRPPAARATLAAAAAPLAPDALTYDRRSGGRDEASAPPPPFDPLDVPLDPGVSLVEASAGTGKTFGITLTVLRLLLDRDAAGAYRVGGIGRILVVTFTIAATDELITRLRAALREAVDVFAGTVATHTAENAHLFALRARYGAEAVDRLRAALASLDQLSVHTIHGFCKRVLEERALESGTPYGAGFLDDDALLVGRAAQDWWRRTVYEDARLASLAVHDGWAHDHFVADWRRWRRHPATRLDPDEPLPTALAALDAAAAAFRATWDPDAAAAYLGGLAWRADAPLADPARRRLLVDAGTALAGGDLGRASEIVQRCTAAAIRHARTGIKLKPKDAYDGVPGHPLVRAAESLKVALTRVRLALRVACIGAIDQEFEAEKRRRHLLGFDDLLGRLQRALTREGDDGSLARAIRGRYDAALIDEFQDTDPFQFDIFSRAFAGRPLFLIGDPKQAIYGFRGADIHAYMDAARRAERAYTLGRNWRSTPRMVAAVNALFARRPAGFLYDAIPFRPAAAARDPEDPLAGDGRAALHWWFVPPGASAKGDPMGVPKREAQARLHAAVAREAVRLLRPRAAGGGGLRAGQLAVLVRTGREGASVARALREARVPCVVAGMGDILASPEMQELERVLRAVLAPQDAAAVRAALATTLWGADAERIRRLALAEHEPEWAALLDQLAQARAAWARHGFVRMAQALMADLGALERLLACDDGERRVTNLRHAVELLHTASAEQRLSPEGLLLWVSRARATGGEDAERVELRLESDADAVQIVTVHKSKGLEYDVVFCPGLWAARRAGADEPVVVHEGGGVVFDHGSPRHAERARAADADSLAEDLRLAYVALTRARFRCYVGWGPIANRRTGQGAAQSALGYLLREDVAAGTPADVAAAAATQLAATLGAWRGTLDALVASSGGAMSVEVLADAGAPVAPLAADAPAAPAPHGRACDLAPGQLETWRVASFTSLTATGAAATDAAAPVEDARDVADGPADGTADGTADATAEATPTGGGVTPLDAFPDLPAGRALGIALHELFERADFASDAPALRPLAAEVLVRGRLIPDAADARADATARMAARVLGAVLPGADFALRDVPRGRTLREWGFHLPLGAVGPDTLARLFATHGGDVARRYAPALRALAPRRTWGLLTGVVDLAFAHGGRWHVVDWKSNHLGPAPGDYDAAGVADEMVASHYVLQYHLYVTALHRFLRLRVPGYAYDTHMGGVWYAFLRGIAGPNAGPNVGPNAGPPARGWWHDRPPAPLIGALDALMDAPGAGARGGPA